MKPCAGNEYPIESPTPDQSDAVTLAESGGRSTATSRANASAETAGNNTEPAPLVIDGWLCDPANQFGHSVCRAVRQLDGDWPPALVLTSGDGPGERSKRIDVPARVLAWLLTGEAEQ